MGKVIGKATDFVGLTDSGAQKAAGKAGQEASQLQADYQNRALDYLKEQSKLPTEMRDQSLKGLQDLFINGGLQTFDNIQGPASQQELLGQARNSPIYDSIMGSREAGERSIARNASSAGGLRGGSTIGDMTNYNTQLEQSALMNSYQDAARRDQERMQFDRGERAFNIGERDYRNNGLFNLAGLDTNTNQIAGLTGQIGQTLGQGQMALAQGKLNASNQRTGLMQGILQSSFDAAKSMAKSTAGG